MGWISRLNDTEPSEIAKRMNENVMSRGVSMLSNDWKNKGLHGKYSGNVKDSDVECEING